MKRWTTSALLVSALACGGCKREKGYELPSSPPVVETSAGLGDAGEGDRSGRDAAAGEGEQRPYTGTTEAHRKSTLTSRVGGVIAKVHVREGDTVKAGDALVSIDTSDNVLRLRQAEAALKSAEVQRANTKIEWDRSHGLLQDRAIPQSQFDAVDARLKGAEAALAQAQVAVDMSRKALADSTVRAPYAGTVTRKLVSEGEYAAVTPPTPLVTLEETGLLDVRIQVPASDEAVARPGAPVILRFPALDREVRATVSRVVPSADPRTRTFATIIEIPNADGAVRPGLFAEARFVSGGGAQAKNQDAGARP